MATWLYKLADNFFLRGKSSINYVIHDDPASLKCPRMGFLANPSAFGLVFLIFDLLLSSDKKEKGIDSG